MRMLVVLALLVAGSLLSSGCGATPAYSAKERSRLIGRNWGYEARQINDDAAARFVNRQRSGDTPQLKCTSAIEKWRPFRRVAQRVAVVDRLGIGKPGDEQRPAVGRPGRGATKARHQSRRGTRSRARLRFFVPPRRWCLNRRDPD